MPAKRVALASEFSAGNTPEWYKALPTDVQSYFAEVKRQIAATGVGEAKAAEEKKSSGGGKVVSVQGMGLVVGLVGAVVVGVMV